VLLAGRFLVPRASMLALPDGPVAALDLSSGASVSLAFGPPEVDRAELEARIARWNALELDGCPVVTDLRWQLGRPLISCEPLHGLPPRPPLALERPLLVARAAALGAALDAADLGLAVRVVDLAVGPLGVCLRRPAVWPVDPERPLARALADAAARLLDLRPEADPAPASVRRRWTRPAAGFRARGPRRGRVALALGVVVVAAVVSSSLLGGSRGAAPARAANAYRPTAPRQVATVRAAPAHAPLRRPRVRPTSRGGPARVLLVAPRPRPRATAPAPVPVTHVAVTPHPGWVAGLFVGQ
jgi:hypothetical protein